MTIVGVNVGHGQAGVSTDSFHVIADRFVARGPGLMGPGADQELHRTGPLQQGAHGRQDLGQRFVACAVVEQDANALAGDLIGKCPGLAGDGLAQILGRILTVSSLPRPDDLLNVAIGNLKRNHAHSVVKIYIHNTLAVLKSPCVCAHTNRTVPTFPVATSP